MNDIMTYSNYFGFHRMDGPAVISPDGSEFWWLNGIQYSFDKWIEKVNISGEEKMELVLRYG